ncbi:MAG: hypothetical protein AVO39_11135 [delta proteobacterium MLS_D]|nr:MAG: hypothetical protein AVO39_11135 [delta proteobacterium MLS_D]
MRDLIRQEQFELEVLDRLNSGRFLERLVFGGGTMLRLCHGLDRFSVDLDFWLLPGTADGTREEKVDRWFDRLKQYLARYYKIRDAMDKFYTLVFELRSTSYPRSLKLEMRKKMEIRGTDQAIAYSPHSTVQVLVQTLSLQEMMASKIEAFLDRGEIRDAYDLEFLVKRGLKAAISRDKANRVVSAIESLTPRDYNVKLGSLLEADQRAYYREKNFAILKEAMADI